MYAILTLSNSLYGHQYALPISKLEKTLELLDSLAPCNYTYHDDLGKIWFKTEKTRPLVEHIEIVRDLHDQPQEEN